MDVASSSEYDQRKHTGHVRGWPRVLGVSALTVAGAAVAVWTDHFLALGVAMLLYSAVEIGSAYVNYHHINRSQEVDDEDPPPPSVGIVMVGYRENPDYWERSLLSIRAACGATRACRLTALVACIDGDDAELDQPMKDTFDLLFAEEDATCDTIAHCHLLPHRGKRHAMVFGFRWLNERCPLPLDYVIVMDSDTYVRSPDAFDALVRCIHRDPKTACATSLLRIFNHDETLLTRIVAARYLYAFLIERGALSAWGCMTCCSGPFSIYRASCLSEALLRDFLQQTYCDQPVGPGDDRHLTLLLLLQGHRARQTAHARAYTETPKTISRFLLQQLRWSRSFYREQTFQVGACGHQSWYLTIVTVYEWLFPLFLLLSLLPFYPFQPSIFTLVRRLVTVAVIVTVRTLALLGLYDGKLSIFYNLLVAPLFFLFLFPPRVLGACTLHMQQWVTSTRAVTARRTPTCWTTASTDSCALATTVLLWNVCLWSAVGWSLWCSLR